MQSEKENKSSNRTISVQYKLIKKDCKGYIRQYVNREWTNFNADFGFLVDIASGKPASEYVQSKYVVSISSNELVYRLPEGRFILQVHLNTINGKLLDSASNGSPYPLYFDCVTVDDRVVQPTSISRNSSNVTYIYEQEIDSDAIIKICYHTEAGGYNGF